MKNKLFYALNTTLIFILAVLVFSQLIWLEQQMEKEKDSFQLKLENNLESMVNFHALQGYSKRNSQNNNTATITIEKATQEEINKDTSNQLARYEINTSRYIHNFSMYKVIEDTYIEIGLKNKKIQLSIIDSIFRQNFTELSFIEAYDMLLFEKGKIIDNVHHLGRNQNVISEDSHGTIHITIPLGSSEIYVFKAIFRLKTLPFLRQMLYSLSVSAIAVILVALFMLWLLFKLQQKVNELRWREQAVSGIVHDLKSPVSYTYTFLDYLASKEQSEPMQRQFSNASTNIGKLSSKIDLILTLFRGNSVKIGLNPEPYPLAAKCEELLSELKVIYQNRQATCTMDIPEEINAFADPVYFEMALHNLLDNAFKYSETPAKIDIKANCTDKKLYIYISDSGKGIAPADQKKIFKQFYRASSNRKGHGIGLSFSQQIIKAHKGEIKLQGNIGKGSTFYIVLPVKPK